MPQPCNPLGQPIGPALPNWQAPPAPVRKLLRGHFCELRPLLPQEHAADLFQAFAAEEQGRGWTYLPYGPFESLAGFQAWLAPLSQQADPLFFSIINLASGRAEGLAAYLRIEPEQGCIEIGHLHFSPLMQRRAIATEAMYLLMREAFTLGYRRYEWKCDALNAASRAAAQRLGFVFEGVWRQARVIKGRNRDTAWFSVIDKDWPILQQAFEAWLSAENFDEDGVQRVALSALRAQRAAGLQEEPA